MMLFQSLFLRLAGIDIANYHRTSETEKSLYYGVGILVFVITLITFLSTSYALYLLYLNHTFESTFIQIVSTGAVGLLSSIWTLIVFNYYRFSVSAGFSHKHELGAKNIAKFIIQLFFSGVTAIVISVPIVVVFGHSELKQNMLASQQSMVNSLHAGIDRSNEEKLLPLYAELSDKQSRLLRAQDTLDKLQKVDKRNQLSIDTKTTTDEAKELKDKIESIRAEIESKKMEVAESIWSNDGLITNFQKALDKNLFLVLLIGFFVLIVLIFPAIFQLIYIPGIYNYVVEFENQIALAHQGVLPHAKQVFVKTDEVLLPLYATPEALLRHQKNQLSEIQKKHFSEN